MKSIVGSRPSSTYATTQSMVDPSIHVPNSENFTIESQCSGAAWWARLIRGRGRINSEALYCAMKYGSIAARYRLMVSWAEERSSTASCMLNTLSAWIRCWVTRSRCATSEGVVRSTVGLEVFTASAVCWPWKAGWPSEPRTLEMLRLLESLGRVDLATRHDLLHENPLSSVQRTLGMVELATLHGNHLSSVRTAAGGSLSTSEPVVTCVQPCPKLIYT
jgi:hypothetical protein